MKKLILLVCIISFSQLFSQKSIVASGGKAVGTTGTASFSVGQISYKSPNGNIVSDGVQQPYEIQLLGKSNFSNISLTMIAYPNPTIDDLHLKITDTILTNFEYTIYDVNGKILTSSKIENEETLLSMKNYSKGLYFIDITSDNTKLKSFKILKK